MNLRDFQYIIAVADECSFSNAARRCHVSQSTLSIQIRKLEDYLGVQLFERSNKQVMLTSPGRLICDHARKILQIAEEIREVARSGKDPFSGEVSIGAFPTLAPYLFPLCLGQIKHTFPKLKLQLVEEKTDILLERLYAGKLDCALIAEPVEGQGIKHFPLFYEPFMLALPTGHRLAHASQIDDAALATVSLLLLDEGHCLREQALEICHLIGNEESGKFRATSLETLRQMVAMGDAVTLIPRLAVRSDSREIMYKPLQNGSFGRNIALCWRETSAKSSLFEKLAECISFKVSTCL